VGQQQTTTPQEAKMNTLYTHSFAVALVQTDHAVLRTQDKAALVAEYRRHHRICDVRELSKSDLVFGILRARYGSKAVSAAF